MGSRQSPPYPNPWFYSLAKRFWPGLESMLPDRRIVGMGEVLTFIYTAPLAVIGLLWLMRISDFAVIRQNAGPMLLLAGLLVLFDRLKYFIIVEIWTNRYGTSEGSLDGIIFWSGIFIFGPTVIWLMVAYNVAETIITLRGSPSTASRWHALRNIMMTLTSYTTIPLVALTVYGRLGGGYPLRGLNAGSVLPAFTALLISFLLTALLWLGYISYGIWTQRVLTGSNRAGPIFLFSLLSLGLPNLANPFSILAAELYSNYGLPAYLFLVSGLVLVAYLSRLLSEKAESARQQSQLLRKLEEFGRAIINAPIDSSALPDILAAHAPTMFPPSFLVVWLSPENVLYLHPEDWRPSLGPIDSWLQNQKESGALTAKEQLPWSEQSTVHRPLVVAPIVDVETTISIGGVYLELRTLTQPWDKRALENLLPAVRGLASQVSSAINQQKVYGQALDYQRVRQELKLAGDIQSGFIPAKIPPILGWQIAVTLDPVEETSGDFFDLIPLSDERLGIVIADVADKGVGPALYMALSRTLIRTFAIELESQPEIVFFAANERILNDTSANLFVTAFYGILDLKSGQLTYCNAGHNPPFLISSQGGDGIHPLESSGMPIGIERGATWTQKTVQLTPGDVLLLYTDGIPEAQNEEGKLFGEHPLASTAQANLGRTAEQIQKAILTEVYEFVGNAPQSDDITLIVLIRNV